MIPNQVQVSLQTGKYLSTKIGYITEYTSFVLISFSDISLFLYLRERGNPWMQSFRKNFDMSLSLRSELLSKGFPTTIFPLDYRITKEKIIRVYT